MHPEHVSDPLFWPLLFIATIVAVFAVAMVAVVKVLARRETDPRDQRQHAGERGSNIYDASSHSSTTIGELKVNLNSPRLPG